MVLNNSTALSPGQPFTGNRVQRISRRSAGADNRGAKEEMIRICTVNIGTLIGKRREVAEMLAKRRVDICCMQDLRYKNSGTTSFGSNEEKYKIWYSGNKDGIGGVGILVQNDLVERVLEVVRYSDRLMKVIILLGKTICHVFSAYTPQTGRPAQEKEDFWERFEEEVARVPGTEGLFVGGDLNGHVGAERDGYEEVMGPNGFGISNREGISILEFAKHHNLRILNTFYKKDRNKTVTYTSGGAETQLDYILARPRNDITPVDCRAIPGECCVAQHRPVRADIKLSGMKRRKVQGRRKVKVWKLKDEATRGVFRDRIAERLQMAEGHWTELQNSVMEVCREVCGETSGARGRERESWWWCDDVQHAIKEKKVAYKIWQNNKCQATKDSYVIKKNNARRAVSKAKRDALDVWCEDLGTTEGKRKMFAMAKQQRRDKKEIIGGYFVKNQDSTILTTTTEIRCRWKCYFEELLNEENENFIEEGGCVEGPICEVTEEEVRVALRAMKPNKAPGPSGLTCDILKVAGEPVVKQMTTVLQNIMLTEKCPSEWSHSTTIPIFKGKGDPLQCGKYRGLRLLEHGMKVWEKILDGRLKSIVNISNNQFGFMPGRSTTDASFIFRQLQQKYSEKKKRLYHIFVDLEKAFDRVPREAIGWALRRQLVPEKLVRLVMALYGDSMSCIKAADGL